MRRNRTKTPALLAGAADRKKQKHTGVLGRLAAFAAGVFSAPARVLAAAGFSGLDTVNKAQGFLLDTVTGVGVCFIAFGVISLAISFQSHDDSQRSKAVMAIVGGAIAVSVRFVLDALGVAHQ